MTAIIYTDGSCHTQLRFGAWGAILFVGKKKIILKDTCEDTTHNRMEVEAVIHALNYLTNHHPDYRAAVVISDSQYVVRLRERKQKLIQRHFMTNSGKLIQNVDLVKKLFLFDDRLNLKYEKIKAHQQKKDGVVNYNIEIDSIVRALMKRGRPDVRITGSSTIL